MIPSFQQRLHPPNHAGGLRFHGMSTTLSQLCRDGFMEAVAVPRTDEAACVAWLMRLYQEKTGGAG